ncbi:MAG: glycosyltransferase family 92 protein [Candidatus Omnitrophica bacterium]|nr:glycosyltransferase family 92 protein [Candidatus Omnitrophota bacterium]
MTNYFNLAVVAIFKNEALYLKDWIEFHLKVGVEHFYLYNNNSSDNYREVLQPFKGVIDIYDWPIHPGQMQAYADCVLTKANTKWLAAIDIDEYLFPVKNDNLSATLEAYDRPEISSLCVFWVIFGSDGKEIYEPIPAPIRFQFRCFGKGETPHVKSIIRPDRVLVPPVNPHFFSPRPASSGQVVMHNVDEEFAVVEKAMARIEKINIIRINHYFTKSKQEWLVKYNRGKSSTGGKKDFDHFNRINDQKRIEDTEILRFYKGFLAEKGT